LNTQRLKEYQAKLILFPIKAKKPRKGDASEEDIKKASQLSGKLMPLKADGKRPRAMDLTEELKNFKAYHTITQARSHGKLWGIRAKKAKEAEQADEITKGKK